MDGKEILKITLVKGSVIKIDTNWQNEKEIEYAASGVVGMMSKNETFAKEMIQYVGHYIINKEKLKSTVDTAIKDATKKISN